jgi:hypothetical protein
MRLRGFDFWASLPSAIRLQSVAGVRSCLGLCLLQVCGRDAAHALGLDPARIISLRDPAARLLCEPRVPIRSWVCGDASPSLQRIDGADALAGLNAFEARYGPAYLYEVRHRP